MKKVLLGFFNLFFTVLGVSVGNFLVSVYPEYWKEYLGEWVGATPGLVMYFLFGAAFYLISNLLIKSLLEWYEKWTLDVSFQKIWCDFLGGVLGLIAGNLFFMVPYYFFYRFDLGELEYEAREILTILKIFFPLSVNLVSFFVGVTVLSRLTSIKLGDEPSSSSEMTVLDTNIVIDGRIIEFIRTGAMRGKISIPEPVLHELQILADSSDSGKRLRGRKGLENLEKLRELYPKKIEIIQVDSEDQKVDDFLVQFCREKKALLFTNDFNLAKVARLQLVECLSLNEMISSLKPVLVPGEDVVVELVKPGKETHQAIGYLEDGTMIVVEQGRKYLGRLLEATVTNIIQTQAGRIIFARLKI